MFFHKYKRQIMIILAVLLAVCMVVPTLAMVITTVSAAEMSSEELAEIRASIGAELQAVGGELSSLEGMSQELIDQMEQINAQLEENQDETRAVVYQKYDLDQKVDILRQQVENTNEQIRQYNRLIAARQQELDLAMEAEQAQYDKYKQRLRAMEENGDITYLSILFNAGSFAELLDSIDLVREIAESDQKLLSELEASRLEVQAAQDALEAEKDKLNESKELLAQQEAQLAQERENANALISDLGLEADEFAREFEIVEAQDAELQEEIMAKLSEYNAVQARYNEASAAEQAARAREEAERERQRAAASTVTSTSSAASTYSSYSTGAVTESGFLSPLPSGSWTITDTFGGRTHPITGSYSFHTGLDMAANSGTNIYAAKSGTVIESGTSTSYGEYVVVAHGGGEATLYGHMSSRAVSSGEYVSQGQTIGYVGSTGWSTGPHLHFEIIINEEYYNPISYIS